MKLGSDDRGGFVLKDVNFNKRLLHLFPKKLEYTFFFGTPGIYRDTQNVTANLECVIRFTSFKKSHGAF